MVNLNYQDRLPSFAAPLSLKRRSFGYFPSLLKESNVRRKVMLIFLGGGSCGGSRLEIVRGYLMPGRGGDIGCFLRWCCSGGDLGLGVDINWD